MIIRIAFARLAKIFALVLSIFFFFSSEPAMAKLICPQTQINGQVVDLAATVKNGSFTLDATFDNPLPSEANVRRAILVLPDAEVGTIKSIEITGTAADGSTTPLFGCINTNVRNGTDLIKACGGPAKLPNKDTLTKLRYKAEGIGFGPNPNFKFNVVLFDDFAT